MKVQHLAVANPRTFSARSMPTRAERVTSAILAGTPVSIAGKTLSRPKPAQRDDAGLPRADTSTSDLEFLHAPASIGVDRLGRPKQRGGDVDRAFGSLRYKAANGNNVVHMCGIIGVSFKR
jgi:hypothetical protein